jgi:hypothetical protein
MAARSRPRGGQIKDEYDEERSLWNQIKSDARHIDQLMVSISHYTQHIIDMPLYSISAVSREIRRLADSAGYIGAGATPEQQWTRIQSVAQNIDDLVVSDCTAAITQPSLHP